MDKIKNNKIMRYHTLKKNATQFLSLTGLTVEYF